MDWTSTPPRGILCGTSGGVLRWRAPTALYLAGLRVAQSFGDDCVQIPMSAPPLCHTLIDFTAFRLKGFRMIRDFIRRALCRATLTEKNPRAL